MKRLIWLLVLIASPVWAQGTNPGPEYVSTCCGASLGPPYTGGNQIGGPYWATSVADAADRMCAGEYANQIKRNGTYCGHNNKLPAIGEYVGAIVLADNSVQCQGSCGDRGTIAVPITLFTGPAVVSFTPNTCPGYTKYIGSSCECGVNQIYDQPNNRCLPYVPPPSGSTAFTPNIAFGGTALTDSQYGSVRTAAYVTSGDQAVVTINLSTVGTMPSGAVTITGLPTQPDASFPYGSGTGAGFFSTSATSAIIALASGGGISLMNASGHWLTNADFPSSGSAISLSITYK